MALGSGDLLALWNRLAPLPGGRRLASLLVRRAVPYTGSIRPRLLDLAPGRAVVAMRDRRAVRNHLRSVHAVALANLAEAASGLALLAALPRDARAILVRLTVDYLKKARGPLRATGTCEPIAAAEPREIEIEAEIRDAGGEVVARGRARWRVGPARPDDRS